MPKKMNIFIAGGGTGGHLYPGISIANALLKQNKNLDIHFIGTSSGLEAKVIPETPFDLHFVSVGGLSKVGFFNKISVLLLFPIAFIQSIYLLLVHRPKVVIGVGGYASGPIVMTAAFLGFNTAIFVADSVPGITNKILSKFVKKCYTAYKPFPEIEHKSLVVGYPLRKAMQVQNRSESDKLRILVFGGSQGARAINRTVSSAIISNPEWLNKVVIVHQTGVLDFDEINEKYKNIENVKCYEYLDSIQVNYAWADVVFCRSGSGSLTELSACQKAAVLIPYPYHADLHQIKNAEVFEKAGAAKLILQENFNPEVFGKAIQSFIDDPSQIHSLEQKIKTFQKPEAASAIAKDLLERL